MRTEQPANDNTRRSVASRRISPLRAGMLYCPYCGGMLEPGESAEDCSVALRLAPVRPFRAS